MKKAFYGLAGLTLALVIFSITAVVLAIWASSQNVQWAATAGLAIILTIFSGVAAAFSFEASL